MLQIEELQAQLASAMLATLNAGATLAEVRISCLWATSEITSAEVTKDGRGDSVPSLEAGHALEKLRELMASDQHGTWFSAIAIVDRAKNVFDVKYNYDQEPTWDIAPDDLTYIEDIEKYPRPYAEIPAWHPAKRTFSDEQWTQKFPQFSRSTD